jgi:hypothetical protein
MLTLFMVSGSIAAVSAAVIGIEYLGIHFILEHGDSIQTAGNQSLVAQESQALAIQECHALVAQESQALAIQECHALVAQESRSDTPNIEKLRQPSVIAEQEETERAC